MKKKQKKRQNLIYMKYKFLMQKVANDVSHDHFLAEDAVHNAFMNISKNMVKIGEIEDVKTKRFLFTIVKNTAIDMYRKRRTQMQREVFVDEMINEAEIPRTFIETDIENMVIVTIRNQPVRYSDVILLKYLYQLDNKEISDLLKISECNVRLRIKRGKEFLRNSLKWRVMKVNTIPYKKRATVVLGFFLVQKESQYTVALFLINLNLFCADPE